jgi:ABC-type oligopeptide transport system substrate-binding subunit
MGAMGRRSHRSAATLLAGVMIACQRSPTDPQRSARGDHEGSASTAARSEIRLPLETTIPTLDPAAAQDAVSQRVTGQLFDTLIDWDPYASAPKLVAEIAEVPTISQFGVGEQRLVFRFRRGDAARRFAPDPCLASADGATAGRPVRPSDAAASLLRHADPAVAGAWELLAGRIAGLDAWRDAPASERPPSPAGIVADDDAGTLVLELTRPQPELLAILASPRLAVVPPECVAYYDGRDASHPPFARHPVGSGPYGLDHAASELPRAAVLVANPAAPVTSMPTPPSGPLPCATLPGIDRVILENYASPEAALRLFQAGTIAAFAPGQAHFDEVIDGGALIPGKTPADARVVREPVLSTTLLVFRMNDPKIGHSDDPAIEREHRALRYLIAAAFDDARYRKVIRNDAWASPATQVTPRALLDRGAILHPAADPRRTRPTAGLKDRVRLRYMTATGPAAQQEAAILREALRPIGVDLEVVHDDLYLSKLLSGQAEAQLFSLRYDADFPDAASFLDPFVCDHPGNYSGFCSADYDRVHAEFAKLPPGDARDTVAEGLERLISLELPVRPIDTPELWMITRGWLRGVVRHPLSGLRVELLCRDP